MSRADRTLIGLATAFGLLAALRFLTEPSPEQQLSRYLLLLCNVPGFLIAAIPFIALGQCCGPQFTRRPSFASGGIKA
jgi:hypothetical protein